MKTAKKTWIQGFFSRKFFLILLSTFLGFQTYAHCDSYDGPVIKEALTALETHNVDLVLKWISQEQEPEIISLFAKTVKLKGGDQEVYSIVEKHFLETLVRLHRETEGEPYTGLKPQGSVTEIIRMADQSLSDGNVNNLSIALTKHIEGVLKEKHKKAVELSKVKDTSVEKGREYVAAYVDYTHTLEGIHTILLHGAAHGH